MSEEKLHQKKIHASHLVKEPDLQDKRVWQKTENNNKNTIK